jgi:hypothetical protein
MEASKNAQTHISTLQIERQSLVGESPLFAWRSALFNAMPIGEADPAGQAEARASKYSQVQCQRKYAFQIDTSSGPVVTVVNRWATPRPLVLV